MVFLIILLVAGLFCLISGKIKSGDTVYLQGPKARIAGLIFLGTAALALVLVLAGIAYESTGNFSDVQALKQTVNSLSNVLMLNGLILGLAYINFHSVSRETQERGGCLTYGLAYFVFGIVSVVYFSLFGFRSVPSAFRSVMIGIAVIQFICLLGIWLWKKWGVWGFAFLSLISPVIAFLNTKSAFSLFASLIGSLSLVLILYLLVKPKWQFFK